jgi:deoxyribodipyrimidine photo-lyase
MMAREGIHLVWLKRDLRLSDHLPIWEASQSGATVVMFVFEPKLWAMPELDRPHFDFIVQSLEELSAKLLAIGGRLAIRVGELPDVFVELASKYDIAGLYSHEETGNRFTYDRDRAVARWARHSGVTWKQYVQNGVVRPLKSRDGWAEIWHKRMTAPIAPTPASMVIPSDFDWGVVPTGQELGLSSQQKLSVQTGGESRSNEVLESFLSVRSVNYRRGMSSPVTAPNDCSRLSPYLAWGCLSMKSTYQELMAREKELREAPVGSIDSRWLGSLKSFSSRLAWHCHFMQKLEDEPALEFENISRVYDGLRENDFNQERFEAWKLGNTGYPMIDACMRALAQNRWINFRMRALLMSFASNHLWLHWRPTAVHLAKYFLDFEPGIHFSQYQMQSGTTGINTIRIYSPVKQVSDQDPTGEFIRRYVPELEQVPNKYLPEPHRMPMHVQSQVGCVVGRDYPVPIVDHRTAYRMAQERIFEIRQTEEAIDESKRVYQKHGSRKKRDPLPKPKSIPKPKEKSDLRQLFLFDDSHEENV